MDHLFVIDGVSDYQTWRKVFDADGDGHKKFPPSMVAGPHRDGQVAIIVRDVDMAAMGSFMSTPDFAERAADADNVADGVRDSTFGTTDGGATFTERVAG